MKSHRQFAYVANHQFQVILALTVLTLIVVSGLFLPSGASANTHEQINKAKTAYPFNTGANLSAKAQTEPTFMLVKGGGDGGGGGKGRGRGRGRGRGGSLHSGSGRHGGFDDRGFDDHGNHFVVDEFGNVIEFDDHGFDDHGLDFDNGFDDHGFHGPGHT